MFRLGKLPTTVYFIIGKKEGGVLRQGRLMKTAISFGRFLGRLSRSMKVVQISK
jgi:hypothetical protein